MGVVGFCIASFLKLQSGNDKPYQLNMQACLAKWTEDPCQPLKFDISGGSFKILDKRGEGLVREGFDRERGLKQGFESVQ